MHLPLLHISDREITYSRDEDPLGLGQYQGRDIIPWLADPKKAEVMALHRIPALSAGSLALAAIGSEMTYFALLASLFSAYNRTTALSLASAVVPSVALNQLVKAKFRFERPPRSTMHPYAFVAPGDYTFPSGHSQNAVVLGLFLATRVKNLGLKSLGVSLATLIPLSRIYLGVHYPRDVIVGVTLGVCTLAGVNLLEMPFRDWWAKQARGPRGFTFLLASNIAGLLSGTPLAAFPLAVGGGLAMGHDLSGQKRFSLDAPTSRTQRAAQGAIGLTVFLGAGFAIRPLMKRESAAAAVLAGSFVGLALTFGVPIANNLAKRINIWRKGSKADAKRRRVKKPVKIRRIDSDKE
jgi:membrane-associated phospholipid phosphatase